jgi:heterodisulfide reductase subunit C
MMPIPDVFDKEEYKKPDSPGMQAFDFLRRSVYDCLSSESGISNPNLWLCVSCHKCEEVCPYDVSPIKFIEALKGEALNSGSVHSTILSEVSQIISTGYSFPITSTTDRMRQSLNLESLPADAVLDLQMIASRTGLTRRMSGGSR